MHFLFVARSPAASLRCLMARIRALVSNSPCNISHFTAYITFATEKMHQLLVFYVLYISTKYHKGNQSNRLKKTLPRSSSIMRLAFARLLASSTTMTESLYVFYKESSIKNPNFLKALSISSKSCFVSASTK